MKEADNIDPVRVIKKNHTSLTGKISSNKSDRLHSFESSLERDFIKITDFNPNVAKFIEQPVTIEYELEGSTRSYVPDFLVYYKNDNPFLKPLKPILVEVKYRADLKNKWKQLKPKFMAAMKFCEKNGWVFKIVTENEIRTEFLFNANFLSAYKNASEIRIQDVELLLNEIYKKEETTPKELILKLSKNEKRQGVLLYTIWYMISVYMINTDLSKKVNMNTLIWSKNEKDKV